MKVKPLSLSRSGCFLSVARIYPTVILRHPSASLSRLYCVGTFGTGNMGWFSAAYTDQL